MFSLRRRANEKDMLTDSFEKLLIQKTIIDRDVDQLAKIFRDLSVKDQFSFKDAKWIICFILVIFLATSLGLLTWSDTKITTNSEQRKNIDPPSPPETSNSKFPVLPKRPPRSPRTKPAKPPRKHDPHRGTKNFVITHFHLAWTWSSGFCENGTTCWPEVEANKFYLHGLWPVNIKGRSKLNCRPLPYNQEDQEALSRILGEELVNELREFYPSFEITRGFGNQILASPNFWHHEFEKHGVCAQEADININAYFRMVIDLAKMNFDNAFAEMIQIASTSHTPGEFAVALNPIIVGRRFYLSCVKDSRLTHLLICVDFDGELMACPEYSRGFGCNENPLTFHKDWTY